MCSFSTYIIPFFSSITNRVEGNIIKLKNINCLSERIYLKGYIKQAENSLNIFPVKSAENKGTRLGVFWKCFESSSEYTFQGKYYGFAILLIAFY